jgi:hypothetical protein
LPEGTPGDRVPAVIIGGRPHSLAVQPDTQQIKGHQFMECHNPLAAMDKIIRAGKVDHIKML